MIRAGDSTYGAQEVRLPRLFLDVVHGQRCTVAQHVDHPGGHVMAVLQHLMYPHHVVQPGELQLHVFIGAF
ncbi:hypothetical protein D3C79_1014600 [compost metagenome]